MLLVQPPNRSMSDAALRIDEPVSRTIAYDPSECLKHPSQFGLIKASRQSAKSSRVASGGRKSIVSALREPEALVPNGMTLLLDGQTGKLPGLIVYTGRPTGGRRITGRRRRRSRFGGIARRRSAGWRRLVSLRRTLAGRWTFAGRRPSRRRPPIHWGASAGRLPVTGRRLFASSSGRSYL